MFGLQCLTLIMKQACVFAMTRHCAMLQAVLWRTVRGHAQGGRAAGDIHSLTVSLQRHHQCQPGRCETDNPCHVRQGRGVDAHNRPGEQHVRKPHRLLLGRWDRRTEL